MTRGLVFSLALLGLPASAAEFNAVDASKSGIGFTYSQMGVALEGRFRSFSVQIRFDPARPTAGKAAIDIELASIDTGSPEGDEEVAGKQWFNTKAFPRARFESTSVRPLGGNRYEVVGKLTIKGRTQEVGAPFTFAMQGNTGTFDGTFTLKRADFSIGEGPWADFGTVANEIRIKFHILAAAGK
jgi:polyisoprenoid-binding protein YceI